MRNPVRCSAMVFRPYGFALWGPLPSIVLSVREPPLYTLLCTCVHQPAAAARVKSWLVTHTPKALCASDRRLLKHGFVALPMAVSHHLCPQHRYRVPSSPCPSCAPACVPTLVSVNMPRQGGCSPCGPLPPLRVHAQGACHSLL